ncbi:MAG: hypothetical protein SOY17_02175 [Evtepia sp.]|nr:hypothetical protein [Evtepia sp.]
MGNLFQFHGGITSFPATYFNKNRGEKQRRRALETLSGKKTKKVGIRKKMVVQNNEGKSPRITREKGKEEPDERDEKPLQKE